MQIIVHGATGRMGQLICAAAGNEVTARISPGYPTSENGCWRTLAEYQGSADCVIDFSHHSATGALVDYCLARRLPLLIATTGQTELERAQIKAAAAEIPVFFASNYSLGIAVLADIARRATAMFPDADIEIVEMHHNQKLDVPSGTALTLASSITSVRPSAELVIGRHENGKREKKQIGIHSLRLGNLSGTHEILIATGSEVLTLRHEARDRTLFADGALQAAHFLVGKPTGLYTMQDLINEEAIQ